MGIAIGSPGFALIAENSQAYHLVVVAVEDAGVVDVHPLAKHPLLLPLDLNVDEHPGLAAVADSHFHQFISQPLAQVSIADNLLEFGVEKLVALVPVNLRVDVGKEEGYKWLKPTFQGFFPRTVIAVGFSGHCFCFLLHVPLPSSPRKILVVSCLLPLRIQGRLD